VFKPPVVDIVGVGGIGFTVTLVVDEIGDEQLFISVTTKVILEVVFTEIVEVVSPVDHKYEKPAGAAKVRFPPSQKVVGPDGVIKGEAGSGLETTDTSADGTLQPFASDIVTETSWVVETEIV
jgi:hypothetical protein